jgi:hypothetical protein
MFIDVTRFRGDHRLVGLQDCRQNSKIRLRTARDKVNVSLSSTKSFSDESSRLDGKRIHYISRFLLEVGSRQGFQNARMRAFRVIVKEEVFVSHRSFIASKKMNISLSHNRLSEESGLSARTSISDDSNPTQANEISAFFGGIFIASPDQLSTKPPLC